MFSMNLKRKWKISRIHVIYWALRSKNFELSFSLLLFPSMDVLFFRLILRDKGCVLWLREIGARQAKLTPLRMPDVWQPCSAMLENYQMSSSSSEDKHLAGPDEKEIKWRTLESPKSTVKFQFGDCIGSVNFRVLWGYRSSFLKPRLTGTWKIKQTCRLQGRLCNLWTSLRKFIHSLLIRETLYEK